MTGATARRWAARFVWPAVAAPLAGCKLAVLAPVGRIGVENKMILIDSLAIMLAIVIPTIVAILGFAWWYRASNSKARYLPDWSYSGQLEMVTWAIPALTVLLLGGVAWVGSHDLDPAKPIASPVKPLEVQVVSLDWKWLFIYPEQHVASVNKLVVPVGVPLHMELTSASVMNTFFVPQLGSMIYTMNGMVQQLNLIAEEAGTYHGLSGHFSGDGFSTMHFETDAVSPDKFAAWAAETSKSGPVLDETNYMGLAAQSMDVAPFTYRAVGPDLFARIATQLIPPASGPDNMMPHRNVSPKTE